MRALGGVVFMLAAFGMTVLVGAIRGEINWDLAIGSAIGGLIAGTFIVPLFLKGRNAKPQS